MEEVEGSNPSRSTKLFKHFAAHLSLTPARGVHLESNGMGSLGIVVWNHAPVGLP